MNIIENETTKHNLLIVDDEIEITKSLARQFRRKYNVFTATNASDAIHIMEKDHIQVVLSDQRMPEITGVDFFNIIKDKYPNALKLILTGYADIEAVIGAINEGQVFRYITKPWNPAELQTTIKEAFEKYELITKNQQLLSSLQEANHNLEDKVQQRTQELETTNNKLKTLNIEKNKYIGIVAHDLRNPIGTAKSFSELLLEDCDYCTQEQKTQYISIINDRCNFALNLMDNFLDVSKIESGVLHLNIEKLDYVAFMRENAKYNNILAHKKGQKIIIKTELSELLVAFDKDKIQQVISNLLSNAIKYSHPNKKIVIDVSKTESQIITKIIDEGQGIPPKELSTIFNPFQIASVKSTNKEKSTGLGLAIVKKIIESHKGDILVESEVGKGSTFTITIPVQ